ncbi:MAG: ABC transporter substrate-binding protein [Thermoplasmatales archaeon]
MTQQESPQPAPPQPKRSSAAKWIAVVVVVIIVIAAVVVVVTYHPTSPKKPVPTTLAITVTTSGVTTQAGTPITLTPSIPSSFKWTKMVWNFGDGTTTTLTSGNGVVTHTYAVPGSYLVSVYATNSTSTATSNASLLQITVNPPLSPNPAAIYGPIAIQASSQNGNATLAVGGWINLTYAGTLAGIPVTVGSPVPGDVSFKVKSFVWNVDNGAQIINDNNTKIPETVNLTFSTPGIHTVNLTTTTVSGTTTVTGSYILTVAVGNYTIGVPPTTAAVNKNVLLNAEYVPGGPRTLDPAIAYDTVSYEVLYEIYEPLIYYNGTSLTEFHPVIAKQVPTVANGEVTPNYLNWTFYINSSATFSNGDHATPYDVYESLLRTLLFSNDPGTPGWIIAHALLPAPTIYGPFNLSFYWIHHAITWNNTTYSVTFHLLPSTPTWLPNTTATYAGQSYGILNQSYQVQNFGAASYFLQLLAGPVASYIMDYNWLIANNHTAPQPTLPQNTSSSYANFEIYGTEGNFNTFLEYNTMGSGPYELSLYEAAQLVVLTVNPYYNQTSSQLPVKSALIPKVELEYLTNEATAQEDLASGTAQFASGAYPPDATPEAQALIKKGVIAAATASEMSDFFFAFNLNINVTGAKSYDSSINIWPGFFDNLSIRKAFSYAFNYSYYINVAEYSSGEYFMNQITGILPPGIEYYPSNISQYAIQYNLTLARFYYNQSGYNNGTWNFPAFNSEGQPPQDEMYTVWENALSAMSGGKIQMQTVDIPFAYTVQYSTVGPGQNIMPIYFLGWIDDYPNPTDFVAPELQEYGIYTYPDGLFYNSTVTTFSPTKNADYAAQWANITKMWDLLAQANEETNGTEITKLYFEAEKIAVNLFLYVGTTQPIGVLYYSTALNPAGLTPTLNTAVGTSFIIYYSLTYK